MLVPVPTHQPGASAGNTTQGPVGPVPPTPRPTGLPSPAWPGWWHHIPSPVTGSEGLCWERPLCQPWCHDPERRADGHIGSGAWGKRGRCHPPPSTAGPVGQVPPSTAGPGQSRWSRGTAGHSSSPAPRGPALLTEVASAVSVVPAWAVAVVSLLPGVPPSTCQSKGNQVSLEVPAGSG